MTLSGAVAESSVGVGRRRLVLRGRLGELPDYDLVADRIGRAAPGESWAAQLDLFERVRTAG